MRGGTSASILAVTVCEDLLALAVFACHCPVQCHGACCADMGLCPRADCPGLGLGSVSLSCNTDSDGVTTQSDGGG